ncbi:YdcF family protein [Acinetobacter puyangensis]|uniref:Uncharacterized SAM-binding protein YcdF, DUF218 family n=1 Tax=Acinetobacter puyangensis TaxID=1096779 RepID=A0A240E6J6_9GAMM|nr:YdcF family protein [Acinetobacter puyangensis]SNX44131.1 Uncharacterized SAM-binding protein YcdF, DUF218 family [Acinetobacter puyangensis]
MAEKAHAIVRLLRWLIALIFLAAVLTVFVYSPFYAKTILWVLNHAVNVQVDPIAAQSQKTGRLSLESNLEPGSPEWVARRAYLYEVNQSLQDGHAENFIELQQRYEMLQQMIAEQKLEEATPELKLEAQAQDSDENSSDENSNEEEPPAIDFMQQFQQDENEPLFQQYREFLTKNENLTHITNLHGNNVQEKFESPYVLQRPAYQPHAIVILGGGLTIGKDKHDIVPNLYTVKRLEQAVQIYNSHHLPILLSGVEAPYMQKWLDQHHIQAQFLENRSMNTCENTRFSSLLLQKQGGAPTVFLITDAYHMPRSRELFAKNGIRTIPVVSPLPNALTPWQPSRQNWMHSRRANYELLALIYNKLLGERNCREIP